MYAGASVSTVDVHLCAFVSLFIFTSCEAMLLTSLPALGNSVSVSHNF